jgi:hypothetical protein
VTVVVAVVRTVFERLPAREVPASSGRARVERSGVTRAWSRARSLIRKRTDTVAVGPRRATTAGVALTRRSVGVATVGGRSGAGGAMTVTTVAVSFAGWISPGCAEEVAVRVRVPGSRTTVCTSTVATRSPDRKSRSQVSAVVPVQPGPRSD